MAFKSTVLAAVLALSASASPAELNNGGRDTLQTCARAMDDKLPDYTPPSFEFSGNIRKYYIAAEEIEWDFSPTGWDNWLGVPLKDSPRAIAAGALDYGTKWTKALYRGYTDDTFTTKTEQPPYQGIQGPTIRAEVGDMIEILFVNKLTQNYATMHSMGLAYTKYSEGSTYPNNTMPGENVVLPQTEAVPPVAAGVSPGACVVYKWVVDSNNGPPNGEPAVTHSYHSYVSMQEDTNGGLIGPTFIYAKGQMASTMTNYREIPLLYMVFDESLSILSGINAATLSNGTNPGVNTTVLYAGGNYTSWHPQNVNFQSAQHFPSASKFYSMNGYIFANNPVFDMCYGDKVIWYVNAYGGASHVFHMHGSGYKYLGVNGYAESLNDGVGKTLYQDATALGKWQVLCHVNNHHSTGMVADYQIWPKAKCPLVPLGSSSSNSAGGTSTKPTVTAAASGGYATTTSRAASRASSAPAHSSIRSKQTSTATAAAYRWARSQKK